jgi:hypothetical protein
MSTLLEPLGWSEREGDTDSIIRNQQAKILDLSSSCNILLYSWRFKWSEVQEGGLEVLVHVEDMPREGEISREVDLRRGKMMLRGCTSYDKINTLSRIRNRRSNLDRREFGRSTFSETLFLLLYLNMISREVGRERGGVRGGGGIVVV